MLHDVLPVDKDVQLDPVCVASILADNYTPLFTTVSDGEPHLRPFSSGFVQGIGMFFPLKFQSGCVDSSPLVYRETMCSSFTMKMLLPPAESLVWRHRWEKKEGRCAFCHFCPSVGDDEFFGVCVAHFFSVCCIWRKGQFDLVAQFWLLIRDTNCRSRSTEKWRRRPIVEGEIRARVRKWRIDWSTSICWWRRRWPSMVTLLELSLSRSERNLFSL